MSKFNVGDKVRIVTGGGYGGKFPVKGEYTPDSKDKCPQCGTNGDDIDWGHLEADDNPYQEAECKVCGCRFQEVYEYAGTYVEQNGNRLLELVVPEATPPTFYIAGPMRGYLKYNFPAFDAAAELIQSLGYKAISPASIDREHGFDGMSEFDESNPESLRAVCKRDLDIILGLDKENGDGLIVLPGWEQSTGALAEVAVAKWLKLKIYEYPTMRELKL